jgi:hypothetical protein
MRKEHKHANGDRNTAKHEPSLFSVFEQLDKTRCAG